MLRTFFAEWRTGRVGRLAFIGYELLLFFTIFAATAMLIVLSGGAEYVGILRFGEMIETMGWAGLFGFFLIAVAWFAAHLNLIAKRFRDMGLPAWPTVAGVVSASVLLSWLFPAQGFVFEAASVLQNETLHTIVRTESSIGGIVKDLFDTIVFLMLLLTPSDFFRNKRE